MYNRYLRDEEGAYTRVPMPETPPLEQPPPPPPPREQAARPREWPGAGREVSQLLSHLLERLPLRDVDTGDLLLLLILFFLFEEKADDELLIALGLLLIL